MKRIGNLYDYFLSRECAEEALWKGIEHKRKSKQVRKLWRDGTQYLPDDAVESGAAMLDPAKVEQLLTGILSDLRAGTWRHAPPMHQHRFCTSKSKGTAGKWRDLYCPTLRDHVVHHMAILASERVFTRGMYRFSCGNVIGRGTSDAVHAITRWCRNDMQWRYFVKLDIRHFFDSLTADQVMAALRKRIKDEQLLRIHEQILHSAPVAVPPVAVPIGYYPSPWYANLVLEDMDHYITEQLYKVRRGKRIPWVWHYIRFVDDMLLMGSSKRDLRKAVAAIQAWLHDHLGLELKTSWEIREIARYENGRIVKGTGRIDFIGYSFDRTRTILRAGQYLSTRRLTHRMAKSYQRTHRLDPGQCRTLISKCGSAAPADHATLYRLIDREVPRSMAREVIANADKTRHFRDAPGPDPDPRDRRHGTPDSHGRYPGSGDGRGHPVHRGNAVHGRASHAGPPGAG